MGDEGIVVKSLVLNMHKKHFLLIICVIFIPSVCYSGWPVNITPKAEVLVVDSVTHKPIEKAEVVVTYWKNIPFGGRSFGSLSKGIDRKIFYTGTDGRVRIPRLTSIHIVSYFSFFDVHYVKHPSYITRNSESGDSLPLWAVKNGQRDGKIEWIVELDRLKKN